MISGKDIKKQKGEGVSVPKCGREKRKRTQSKPGLGNVAEVSKVLKQAATHEDASKAR
jgi:hypothetical protein